MVIMQTSNEEDTLNNYYLQNQPVDLSVTKMTKTLNCDTTELSPKICSIKKPIRRRSRASKKTPTNHLNANASNFRALVQQYTGCHTANTFLGAHKGPINLNFGLDEKEDFDVDNSITVSSFGYDCYCNTKGQKVEEQKSILLSVDENRIMGSTSTTNSSSSPTTMDDDFELENLCLNDFITSTENIWDDGYLLI